MGEIKSFTGSHADHRSTEDALFRRITLRLIPILFLAYLFAFLDRVNIGYAKLQMNADLGFSETIYGIGAGLFFITYILCEVPSNLWMERVGARVTLLRIMILWGLVSAATLFVQTPAQFYAVRLALGVCEAGFFPGIILYLTYWFPTERRARVTGQFMLAIPVAGLLGGPVSGWIMKAMDGAGGLQGWQWMFLLESLPAVLLGGLCYLLLADGPDRAKWLSPEEAATVTTALARDGRATPSAHGLSSLKSAVLDPRVWLLGFIYFSTACANYAFTFWLPTLIKNLGVADIGKIGLYSAIPYAGAVLGALLVTSSSDRLRERRWHIGGSLLIAALGLAASTLLADLWVTIGLLVVVAFFQFGAGIAFWVLPSTYLDRSAAAAGIAVVSSIGVLGGFLSPTVLGMIQDATGSLHQGILLTSAVMIAGSLCVLLALPARAVRVGG